MKIKTNLIPFAPFFAFYIAIYSQPVLEPNSTIQGNVFGERALPGIKDWAEMFLKSEKGQPSGNLREIGKKMEYFNNTSSVWIGYDSVVNTYDVNYGYLTNTLYRDYDNVTSSWVFNYNFQLSYNANGWVTQEIGQLWNGASWENDEKLEYTYNSNGTENQIIVYNWNGANWVESKRYDFTYNANNIILTDTRYLWNNGTSSWDPYLKYTFSHNGIGYTIEILEEIWSGGNWVNNSKVNNYYNASNKYIWGIKYAFDTGSSSWINQYKDTLIYSSATTKERIGFSWDNISSSWINDFKENDTYTPSEVLLSRTTSYWNNVSLVWQNSKRTTYTLDAQENSATRWDELWDNVSSTWVNEYYYTYNFNAENYKTYEYVQKWDFMGGIWQDYSRTYYWYETNPFASIADVSAEYGFVAYPNPVQEKINIALKFSTMEDIQLTILNLQGQQMFQTFLPNCNGQFIYSMDMQHLVNGVYVIQIQTSQGIIQQKFIKQ